MYVKTLDGCVGKLLVVLGVVTDIVDHNMGRIFDPGHCCEILKSCAPSSPVSTFPICGFLVTSAGDKICGMTVINGGMVISNTSDGISSNS